MRFRSAFQGRLAYGRCITRRATIHPACFTFTNEFPCLIRSTSQVWQCSHCPPFPQLPASIRAFPKKITTHRACTNIRASTASALLEVQPQFTTRRCCAGKIHYLRKSIEKEYDIGSFFSLACPSSFAHALLTRTSNRLIRIALLHGNGALVILLGHQQTLGHSIDSIVVHSGL